jgi:hypothetical protein
VSRLPTTVGPIPPCPRAWRVVAAAVAVLCADRDVGARCGTDEVSALLWLSGSEMPAGATLHALCAAEARGAVRWVDGAWGPA